MVLRSSFGRQQAVAQSPWRCKLTHPVAAGCGFRGANGRECAGGQPRDEQLAGAETLGSPCQGRTLIEDADREAWRHVRQLVGFGAHRMDQSARGLECRSRVQRPRAFAQNTGGIGRRQASDHQPHLPWSGPSRAASRRRLRRRLPSVPPALPVQPMPPTTQNPQQPADGQIYNRRACCSRGGQCRSYAGLPSLQDLQCANSDLPQLRRGRPAV